MKFGRIIAGLFMIIIAAIFIFPLIATISNSFMSASEVETHYGKITDKSTDMNSALENKTDNKRVGIVLIPNLISIEQYYDTLIEKYDYLMMFWNSVKLSLWIAIGTLIIAFPQAYVFAKVKFKGRDTIFFVYIIVMMMPFQVTLLPNYILLKDFGLLNTQAALILPAVFSPFGVFLLTQFMKYLPNEVVESYRLESDSVVRMFYHIVAPMVKPGIIAMIVLVFADSWNMVEQPLVFLTDESKYPLSLALNSSSLQGQMSAPFAGAVIYVIPIIVLYFYFEEEIIAGFSNWKF